MEYETDFMGLILNIFWDEPVFLFILNLVYYTHCIFQDGNDADDAEAI